MDKIRGEYGNKIERSPREVTVAKDDKQNETKSQFDFLFQDLLRKKHNKMCAIIRKAEIEPILKSLGRSLRELNLVNTFG